MIGAAMLFACSLSGGVVTGSVNQVCLAEADHFVLFPNVVDGSVAGVWGSMEVVKVNQV
jgi:hypothetical protein